MKIISLIIIIFTISYSSYGQVTISGKLSSASGVLPDVHIIAKPITEGAKFSYTVSNTKGEYSLQLTPNASYKFTLSFIGFITLKQEVVIIEENSVQNFVLQVDPNQLEEIVINYKEPVIVKKDTTTYRADAFTNGKERKLRQVLKKLPGVDVDRKGNVTVKGKKVTTVLVDNKTFFTGDSKLAVNNIPADVIYEIQVIEDYHESDLLKGFEESKEVALNISLKKDKKEFIFGDLEAGSDTKDRYVFHPTVFKYSPKINYNFIGDINNVGKKSFTLKDYINYEGGFDVGDFSSFYTSPILRLLVDDNFYNNKHLFGGLNVQINTNKKNEWSAFVIGVGDHSESQINQSQNYLGTAVNEDRETLGSLKQNMLLGKIQLKSRPNETTRIKFENRIELSSANNFNQTNSDITSRNINYATNDSIDNFTYKSNFRIEKQFSKFHTSQAKFNVLFSKNNEEQYWSSDENIFSNALAIEDSDIIKVYQQSSLETFKINSFFKHFWIINPKNHLFLSFKNELFINNFQSNLYQFNPNGVSEFIDFENKNYNKEVFTAFTTEYKRLIGNAFLTLKLEYLNYNRFNNQFALENNKNHKILLPNLTIDWDITANKQLSFNYSLSNKQPTYTLLSTAKQLTSFNAIYAGQLGLNDSYYHDLRVSFRKTQTYGWSFYPTLRYKIIKDKIKNLSILNNGIYTSNTPVNLTNPEKEFSADVRLYYNYKYWKAWLSTNFSNNNYISILNELETKATNNRYTGRASFRSVYINGPNVDATISHTYSDNKTTLFESVSNNTKIDLAIDYEMGNWTFLTENIYDYYTNKASNTNNSFNQINASVFYQKEDSAWGFEIKANNISDSRVKINSSLTDVLFNETRTYVFPRTILGKITYKL
ncbi:TonB-dependent receptor [Psychroserpens sp. NJDZ02]|uniref:TonB-dependent receptor n=1 Tax=Psychroserpens sp. NJDZ02 TaxID=2570561 RepID=UPI0010A9373B|nr:carboxypeptidase-like regulatory domain-containing protein [Psychroserpens sp. NJDZ02]QCE41302.1 TonB-dependent receptor [Psychroserpens sp. NJDZ02]